MKFWWIKKKGKKKPQQWIRIFQRNKERPVFKLKPRVLIDLQPSSCDIWDDDDVWW